jgi:hypothetical protein
MALYRPISSSERDWLRRRGLRTVYAPIVRDTGSLQVTNGLFGIGIAVVKS